MYFFFTQLDYTWWHVDCCGCELECKHKRQQHSGRTVLCNAHINHLHVVYIINSGGSAVVPHTHLYTTGPSYITTHLPIAMTCENVRHKQLHAEH